MDDLIGRKKEMELLTSILSGNRPEFIVVYGRRSKEIFKLVII